MNRADPPPARLDVLAAVRQLFAVLAGDAAAILGLGLVMIGLPVLAGGLVPRGGPAGGGPGGTGLAVLGGLLALLYLAIVSYGALSRLAGKPLPPALVARRGLVASPPGYSVALLQGALLVGFGIAGLLLGLALPEARDFATPFAVLAGFALLVLTLPAVAVALVERVSPLAALRRAAALTRGSRGQVALLLLAFLLTLLPVGLVVREVAAGAGGLAGAWLRAMFAWGAAAVSAPLPAVAYMQLARRN